MKFYKTIILALAVFIFVSCNANKEESSSPTNIVKTYVEASNRKDITTAKQTFSKGTIKMYEGVAQKRQISVDEVLRDQFEYASAKNLMPEIETLGEKIEINSATVEIKNKKTGELGTIPLVKEDDEWKLELDKFIQNTIKNQRLDKESTPPIPSNAPTEGKK